ncbi:hypothetical protein AB0L00_18400 [Actinoallomurus sp. NPDC052308]|uniref:DUF6895 family protein n=1 Tax=Actinoallomurus sp. NPDC052308 TaxID=3155530 RepID=UPI0034217C85
MPSTLDRLAEGTLDWLGHNLEFFDPWSASARSATHGPVKAVLELALLCHCQSRFDARDDRLSEGAALIRALWQSREFQRLIDSQPEYAPRYGLIYAALAPTGIDDRLCRATIARLVADGHLSARGQSPYQRLETRFYADKAGAEHDVEPYEELVALSPLVTLVGTAASDGAPLSTEDAYALTHSSFFLSDFGRQKPGPAYALERTDDLARRMLDHCVEHDRWDLVGELVMTRFCLGHDPLDTPSGVAAVECLVRAQASDGAIPARSAALLPTAPVSAAEAFRKAYHTTIVTALMSLMLTSARP